MAGTLTPWMMMRALLICLASCLLVVSEGNIINRCTLAKILYEEDLDGFEGYSLPDFRRAVLGFCGKPVQHIKGERERRWSFDYGVFQINSRYWCNDYQSHSENFCRINCQELLNPNLISSIHCAKKIVSGSGGMKNWGSMEGALFGRPLSYWMTGCRLL
ncbi:Lysozyme-like protein 6 [Apodemus speciosus]|uniref:Lysozyme-like protein 6 n=1 Tax=Apodemus speciosus TaxID=105296 RepID=A0ABQ0FD20_APOSI